MTNFFGTNEPREYDTIISIGAKPEEKFYKISNLCFSKVYKNLSSLLSVGEK